jgi:CheY-like chemotaxis protein
MKEVQTFGTVMIIDDNNIDLYVTSRMMVKNNFGENILEYPYAQDALQYLIDHQENPERLPQVILVDIYMPMMSGFEFMEEYDKLDDAFKQKCKVYIVSSTIDQTDIDCTKKDINIIGFHEKPVTKEFLQQIINS